MRLSECALCDSNDPLELSHIVPKMVVRALKKTSVGCIRHTDNPNQTVQDSEKHYMLCGKCEDLFSEYEKYFSDNVFQPYLKAEKTRYEYDERLFYFLTSLSWRSLYLDLLDFVQNHVLGLDALECLIQAEKTMKDFLLKRRPDIGNIEHHIFFLDRIECADGDFAAKEMRPHATFHRGIASYSFCDEEHGTYGTLTNMMGILVVTLYQKSKEEVWVNTDICNGTGAVEAKNQKMISTVGNELIHLMKTAKAAEEAISPAQKGKIKERLDKAEETIRSNPVFQDWFDDERIAKSE